MSSDREVLKAAFLADAGMGDARREALPGDASSRSYERLHLGDGRVLMLMDSPPSPNGPVCQPGHSEDARKSLGYNALSRLAASKVEAFAAAAAYLRSLGFSPPDVIAIDAEHGFALLEDLGEDLFIRRIEAGGDERALYFAAVEALAKLHGETPPDTLQAFGHDWPLLDYDALALQTGADLLPDWLPKLDDRVVIGEDARAEWNGMWKPVIARANATPGVFTHRDYHAENLLWLPDRDGVARVGMLDFQDAVRAHPSWDLHSLLQDARRDVPPEIERAALGHYFTLRPGLDREAFMADYAALAALNEARIIGIFSRLVARDAKPRYRAFMPRMWRHLETNLQQPGLETVRAWFDRHVPSEVRR